MGLSSEMSLWMGMENHQVFFMFCSASFHCFHGRTWRLEVGTCVTPNANVYGQASLISNVTFSCRFLGPRQSPTPHPGIPCQHCLQFGRNLGFDNSKTIYWHTQFVVFWEAVNSTLLYQSNFFKSRRECPTIVHNGGCSLSCTTFRSEWGPQWAILSAVWTWASRTPSLSFCSSLRDVIPFALEEAT